MQPRGRGRGAGAGVVRGTGRGQTRVVAGRGNASRGRTGGSSRARLLQSKVRARGVARFKWGMMVLQLPLQVIIVLEQGLDAELVLHRQGKKPLAVIIAVSGSTQHL